jgi:hypothetical protein
MINFHPEAILRVKGTTVPQILLTDFFIPAANQISQDPELSGWYLCQMSPEQVS